MRRRRLTRRVAVLAAVCAATAPVAIVAASATADTAATVRTPAAEQATVRVAGPAAVAPTSTRQGFLGIATEFTTIPDPGGLRRRSGHPLRHTC